MNTLDYILNKYALVFDDKTRMPVEIPNVGRANLADWLHELNFQVGVEVGVAAGEYSEILCKANPQMKLYGVDPYLAYRGYRDYQRESTFNRLLGQAEQRLSHRPNFEFIKELSLDALGRFADNSLDFVYIDANHQDPYVKQDITEWHKKVRSGGIIAGHDYGRLMDKDGITVIHNVRGAVRSFTSDNHIRPWFVLGTTRFKREEIRDHPRSWMWVKS